MQGEGQRFRALRGTALGFANGVSLMLLAVLATAYGTGTAVPFTSVDAFLAVATVWMSGPTGAGPARALGYLGVFVVIASPVWFFLVRPLVGDTFGLDSRTEQSRTSKDERDRVEGDVDVEADGLGDDGETEAGTTEVADDGARAATDEDETEFIWGDPSDTEEAELARNQSEEERDSSGGIHPEPDQRGRSE